MIKIISKVFMEFTTIEKYSQTYPEAYNNIDS